MLEQQGQFAGFPPEGLDFFTGLTFNNEKTWFEDHKEDYERFILQPSRAFVTAMGERLPEISSDIQADPRVNKSLFKIHRDTRFSKDKTPFKTHMGIWFWEGTGKRMNCSGFYFHLEPLKMFVGGGLHKFPQELMAPYRESVVHPKHGPALVDAIAEVSSHKGLNIGAEHYKKTPRGFDPDHPNAKYLLHNGMHAYQEFEGIPDCVHAPELITFCMDIFKKMAPLHRWLLDLTERAQGKTA